MADWTNPQLTSQYTDLLDILKDRDYDLATQFNADTSLATNTPIGAIRWNPTARRWEERNTSNGWDPLVSRFDIDVENLGGQPASYYLSWANLTDAPVSFPPSAHNHDGRYHTKAAAGGLFGAILDSQGDTVQLKAADNTVLSTVTAPYATRAGDATTVGGRHVDQDLRTSDTVTFQFGTLTGGLTVEGLTRTKGVALWNETSAQWHSFGWNTPLGGWTVEDAAGVDQKIFHGGNPPGWGDIGDKPSAFPPADHGHSFNASQRLQVRRTTSSGNSNLTGLVGELTFTSDHGRLFVHNGTDAGGDRIAYTRDIPDSQDLSNYIRRDQPVDLTSSLTLSGGVTSADFLQGKSLKAINPDPAGASKEMLTLEGAGSPLGVFNISLGGYDVHSNPNGGGVRIHEGAGGVQLRAGGATRLTVQSGAIDALVPLTVQGNEAWHSGNDGPLSGLNADLLDGRHASEFYRPHADQLIYDEGGAFRVQVHHEDTTIHFTPRSADGTAWDGSTALQFDTVGRQWSFQGDLLANGTGVVWHSENDGAGSDLDAGKLGGNLPSAYSLVGHTHDDLYLTKDGTAANAQTLQGRSLSYFLPAASYTAGDVLAKLKTVDGNSSGLNASTLQGFSPSHFLPATAYTAAEILAKLKTVDGNSSGLNASTVQGFSLSQLRDASRLATGTIASARLSGSYYINAATATKLKASRKISLTGALTGSGWFDGSGNTSITDTALNYVDVGRGKMFVENHASDQGTGAGFTLRAESPPGTDKPIFAVRSDTGRAGLWVSPTITSFGPNEVRFGTNDVGLAGYSARVTSDGTGFFQQVSPGAGWMIQPDGGDLVFSQSGQKVMRLKANGDLIVKGDIQAYGDVE